MGNNLQISRQMLTQGIMPSSKSIGSAPAAQKIGPAVPPKHQENNSLHQSPATSGVKVSISKAAKQAAG